MTPEESLSKFLSGALQHKWRQRYLSLVVTKRGKKTFLKDLHHVLDERLDIKKLTTLTDSVLKLPAYQFNEYEGFGLEYGTMQEAYDRAGEGFLVVSTNGNHGILIPETIGSEVKQITV